jgi:hypothetical protein
MYEHKRQPLAHKKVFYRRMARSMTFAVITLLIALSIGVLGYHFTDNIPWLDSLHNAAMILAGMGPVVTISSVAGKLFSTFYALFSGVVFITNIGIVLAPAAHRLLHSLHIEEQ